MELDFFEGRLLYQYEIDTILEERKQKNNINNYDRQIKERTLEKKHFRESYDYINMKPGNGSDCDMMDNAY